MSKLFLVGTPIGNLQDFSERGISTLKSVDFIAAEDTRVTRKLLSRFEISRPIVSYYEYNAKERGQEIIKRLQSGESCALVCDAGMPTISDPGESLVLLCIKNDIEVVCIPGPSAAVTALALSGLCTKRFVFEGFLSTGKHKRREHLDSLRFEKRTMIFYEAPHKLRKTLKDMYETFGNRKISIARELTKLHEEVIRTTLQKASLMYETQNPRGEFVLVVEGAHEPAPASSFIEDAVLLALSLLDSGISPAQAAKEAARITGCKKTEIYRKIIEKRTRKE